MPRELPRYSIGITLTDAQLDRLDEMVERYNATTRGTDRSPTTREGLLLVALNTLEPVLFPQAVLRGVFEQ